MTKMIPPLNSSLSSEDAAQGHVSNKVVLSEIAEELAEIGESALSAEEVALFKANGWNQHECVRHIRSTLGLSERALVSRPSPNDSFSDSTGLEPAGLNPIGTTEDFSKVQQKRVWWQILSRIETKHTKSQVGQRVRANRIWPFASAFAVAASLICVWMIEGRSDSGLRDIGRNAHDMLQSLPSLDEHSGLVAGQLQGSQPDRWAQFVARTMLDGGGN